MTRIKNFEELLVEKALLQTRLRAQMNDIKEAVDAIRENTNPLFKVLSFFRTPKNDVATSLLKVGAQVGVGILAQNTLSKAVWIARFLAPVLLGGTAGALFEGLKRRLTGNSRWW